MRRIAALLVLAGLPLTGLAQMLAPPPAPPPAATPAPAPAPANAEPAPAANTPPAPDAAGTSKTGKPVFERGPAPKIETKPDGSVLVDDRFLVKGDGSPENPFEVPWEMLVSAEESFAPDKKLRTIPGRIQMLDGKRVRIVGHVLFPMFVEQPKELLGMMNQWDGCCIGVPPTPYDAVEVKLASKITEDQRFATVGNIEGTFTIEPFLTGDWLVGLYVMNDASFKPTQFGGTGM